MNVMTGDVVEVDLEGGPVTALILLATPEAVIIDALDGSTPLVLDPSALVNVRVFDGGRVDELAA
jgi:hypothetical protein